MLTKPQLIDKVFDWRQRHHDAEILALQWEQRYLEIAEQMQILIQRNEKRYDEILSAKLGVGSSSPSTTTHQPIQLRKPWSAVRTEFETKDRQEHWKQRVKEVEERDAQAMNAKQETK